ncbi:four helix bundle protein [Candidatus Gottesmanbacteria bacterium]|nr:four helix bundle protein [Candidatus Gottesmanbacteria bacterium]
MKFTDLEVWKEAHKLTLFIYSITSQFPKSELYGLTMQLRRASVSVESCIAEGFSRFHYKDRLNFYYDARGSVSEVQSQLIDSKDLKFINLDQFNQAYKLAEMVSIILSGLIRSTVNLSKK